MMIVCLKTVCMKFMDVHDYHRGNTAGLWARWSSECVHTALRRTRLVPCTAVQILQDRRHHHWLNTWLDQLAAELETELGLAMGLWHILEHVSVFVCCIKNNGKGITDSFLGSYRLATMLVVVNNHDQTE